MQFFAVLDPDARPVAFYSDDLFPPSADGTRNLAIPADAVAITADAHLDCITNVGLRKIVDGKAATIEPPAPAPVVPASITRRQFATQAASEGDITQDEALAWLGAGALPAALGGAIAKLSPAQQFPARMALLSDRFDRGSTWTAMLAALLGKDDAMLDAMWIAAAALP